jgi:hypothetical protein
MKFNAITFACWPQLVLQFTHLTPHFFRIAMLPNSGANKPFA